jgi:hypothetical protein
MLFFNRILGFRDFTKLEGIKKFLSEGGFIDTDEDISAAEALVIFETTQQKTWLIVTNKKMYCILDDVDKDTIEVRWKMTKEEIADGKQIKIPFKFYPNFKDTVGKIDFGNLHRGWLYSKKLFTSPEDLKESLDHVIKSKFVQDKQTINKHHGK